MFFPGLLNSPEISRSTYNFSCYFPILLQSGTVRKQLIRVNVSLLTFFFKFIIQSGERYGSSSFRKKLKLARISFETAGTYRIVARGKYCQYEKKVEVRVISKY